MSFGRLAQVADRDVGAPLAILDPRTSQSIKVVSRQPAQRSLNDHGFVHDDKAAVQAPHEWEPAEKRGVVLGRVRLESSAAQRWEVGADETKDRADSILVEIERLKMMATDVRGSASSRASSEGNFHHAQILKRHSCCRLELRCQVDCLRADVLGRNLDPAALGAIEGAGGKGFPVGQDVRGKL